MNTPVMTMRRVCFQPSKQTGRWRDSALQYLREIIELPAQRICPSSFDIWRLICLIRMRSNSYIKKALDPIFIGSSSIWSHTQTPQRNFLFGYFYRSRAAGPL
ncbi:hypothetical protein TWF718_002131 [Orbilia javanica]|uniref:Uncharacterized protein n=1 Tax=Orbilia javanica TaxID=47235 RepID=A0AAN8MMV4_9PEZI